MTLKEELTRIGWGADSIVYSNGSQVIKKYHVLSRDFGAEKTLKALSKYYEDTNTAKDAVEGMSWDLETSIGNFDCSVEFVPQGSLYVSNDILPNTVCASGQELIEGFNLDDAFKNHSFWEMIFDDRVSSHLGVYHILANASHVAGNAVNRIFYLGGVNVKPVIEDQKITFKVTDFASRIVDVYRDILMR